LIKSFRDRRTAAVFLGQRPKGFPSDVAAAALRKLEQLNATPTLDDLRRPPGNRLELLRGSRAGQYSIRINDQWRLCFNWTDGHA
jgi:proteic killer suppression protein